MNRLSDFVSLDSFYISIRGYFQTHFVLEKALCAVFIVNVLLFAALNEFLEKNCAVTSLK